MFSLRLHSSFSWFWQSLACIVGTMTPISASVFMKHFPLYLCLNFPLIIKIPVILHLESALHIMWPKYWSFSFSVSLSNEYSGLIFFRIDWFDLPAVQETLKSLLQHHNSETSVLWCSAFFMVQLSHHTWLLVKHFFPQNGSTTMVPLFCLHSSSSAGFLPYAELRRTLSNTERSLF